MKNNFYFKLSGLLMIVLMFSMPSASLAKQNGVRTQAEHDAKRDAEQNIDREIWFLFGCVGGLMTIMAIHLYQPTPPAVALLGKSPEYVAYYTDAYIENTKNRQIEGAVIGCVGAGIMYTALLIASRR